MQHILRYSPVQEGEHDPGSHERVREIECRESPSSRLALLAAWLSQISHSGEPRAKPQHRRGFRQRDGSKRRRRGRRDHQAHEHGYR